MKKILFGFCLTLLPVVAVADQGIVEVQEVAIVTDQQPASDVFFWARWTDSGDRSQGERSFMQVQQAHFGPEGVSRAQALLTAAFLSGKTVWIRTEGASNRVLALSMRSVR